MTGESPTNAGGTISAEPGWNGMSVCMRVTVCRFIEVYLYIFRYNAEHICECVLYDNIH